MRPGNSGVQQITVSMFNLRNLHKNNWTTVALAAASVPALLFLTIGGAHAQAGFPATTIQLSSVRRDSSPLDLRRSRNP